MREYKTLITLIAIVAVLAGGAYIIKQSHAALQPSLATGTKITSSTSCTAAAKTFFHTWQTAPGNSDMGVLTNGQISYTDHFSTSSATCYIRIDSKPKYTKAVPLNQQGSTSEDYVYLFNVGSGQAVASTDVTMMDTLELCIFNGVSDVANQQYCTDRDSFMAEVNALMTS